MLYWILLLYSAVGILISTYHMQTAYTWREWFHCAVSLLTWVLIGAVVVLYL